MKLLELTLSAIDLEPLRQFYTGILGLREAEPYWTGRLAIQAGDTRLNFIPARPGWRGYYHFAFDVPPDRFEASVRWLRERAIPIASPEGKTQFHSDDWDSDSVYFRDPAGNILELIARYSASKNEQEARTQADDERLRLAGRPFSASEIVAVTEIGLAVSSVADSVAQITERMPGAQVYTGGAVSTGGAGKPGGAGNIGASSDTFTAVGDTNGLLIVVRTGRIWFPNTGVPAQFLPLTILAEVEKGNAMQQRYRIEAPPFPFTINHAP